MAKTGMHSASRTVTGPGGMAGIGRIIENALKVTCAKFGAKMFARDLDMAMYYSYGGSMSFLCREC